MSIDAGQRQLERALYAYHTSDASQAASEALKAINLLNGALKKISKTDDRLPILKSTCSQALQLYKDITSKRAASFGEKLEWMSSKINGELYPLCPDFESVVVEDRPFEDDTTDLSEVQAEHFEKWELCSEKQVSKQWDLSLINLNDVYQDDVLSTCLFVSSFLSIINNDPKIIFKKILPHEDSHRYAVRLYLNGGWRLVFVNDLLPQTSLKDRSLYVRSASLEVYWPAYIEKAYFKILGKNLYDFNGSNAGHDTYILTGWIPEYVQPQEYFIHNDHSVFWNLIKKFWTLKKLLICLGTDDKSRLVKNHDFTVSGLREKNGRKELLVKNPWYSDNREVWYDYHFVINNFGTIYLNWCPDIFDQSKKMKFIYTRTNSENALDSIDISTKPQFSVRNSTLEEIEVWLLLTEDTFDFRETKRRPICLTVLETEKGEKVSSFKASLMPTDGFKSFNKINLLKLKLAAKSAKTVVVHHTNSPGEKKEMLAMNLTCFSMQNGVIFEKAYNAYPCTKIAEGEWNINRPGGNWLYCDYVKNPQYVLSCTSTTKCLVTLFLDSLDVLFNVQVYWYTDKYRRGIQRPDPKKIVSNEKYRDEGAACIKLELREGEKYLVLLSTFLPILDSGLLSLKYKLLVESDKAVELTTVPISLGVFTRSKEFNWGGSNRHSFLFQTSKRTRINLRAYTVQERIKSSDSLNEYASYRPKLRVNVFDNATDKPVYYCVDFDDNLYGVFVNDLIVSAGTFLVVIERFEGGVGGACVDIGGDGIFKLI